MSVLLKLFFTSMLLFPTQLILWRGVILFLFLTLSLFYLNKWSTSIGYFILNFIALSTGLASFLYGYYSGNPGALPLSRIVLIWPLLYFYLTGYVNKIQLFENFERIILYVTLFLTIVYLSFLLGYEGPARVFFTIDGVSIKDDDFGFSHPSITSLFLGNAYISGYLYINYRRLSYSQNFRLVLLLCISSVVLFFSGRNAFIALIIMSPVLLFATKATLVGKKIWLYLFPLMTATLIGSIIILIDWTLLAQIYPVRFETAYVLLESFAAAPLIGHGLGNIVGSSYRSGWTFENSYLYLMQNFGLIGVSIFSAIVWFLLLSIRQFVRVNRRHAYTLFPILYLWTVFLIINLTNPYLLKFDYLWVFFAPFIFYQHLARKVS